MTCLAKALQQLCFFTDFRECGSGTPFTMFKRTKFILKIKTQFKNLTEKANNTFIVSPILRFHIAFPICWASLVQIWRHSCISQGTKLYFVRHK